MLLLKYFFFTFPELLLFLRVNEAFHDPKFQFIACQDIWWDFRLWLIFEIMKKITVSLDCYYLYILCVLWKCLNILVRLLIHIWRYVPLKTQIPVFPRYQRFIEFFIKTSSCEWHRIDLIKWLNNILVCALENSSEKRSYPQGNS